MVGCKAGDRKALGANGYRDAWKVIDQSHLLVETIPYFFSHFILTQAY